MLNWIYVQFLNLVSQKLIKNTAKIHIFSSL